MIALALFALWVCLLVVCSIGFVLVTLWRACQRVTDALLWHRDEKACARLLDLAEPEGAQTALERCQAQLRLSKELDAQFDMPAVEPWWRHLPEECRATRRVRRDNDWRIA